MVLFYEMMLFSEVGFVDYVGCLGISNYMYVVVYDGDYLGSFYVFWVWWMFCVFGYCIVLVFNGGFWNWLKEGYLVIFEFLCLELVVFKVILDCFLFKNYE